MTSSKHQRRGYSLVEMLVVITVGTIIVGIGVSLLVTMFQVEKKSRQHLGTRSTQDRLADRFRRDVRAATGVSHTDPDAEDAAPEWLLRFDSDRQVKYRTSGEGIERIERAGGAVVRREVYELPHGLLAQIDMDDGQSPAIVSLRILRSTKHLQRSTFPSLRIDAVLGGDRRFLAPEESSEDEDS